MPPRMFGPKKQGPDLSWADEDLDDPNDRQNRAVSPPSNVPGPVFPPRTHRNIIRTPKPLSASEKHAVDAQLKFRQRCREGPLFTVLDKNGLLVDGVKRKSEEAKRRGFDPFEQQERYSTRHVKKARTEPDLGQYGRGDYGYTLSMFPEELWGVLDPHQRLPDWQNVKEDSVAYASLGRRPVKKKRKKGLDYEKLDKERAIAGEEQGEQEQSEDEDAIRDGGRRKRRKEATEGQKRGIEAEDDIDVEPGDEDEEAPNDEPEDSEFSESESDVDDYNAEQYFDDGEDDAGDDEYGAGGTEDY